MTKDEHDKVILSAKSSRGAYLLFFGGELHSVFEPVLPSPVETMKLYLTLAACTFECIISRIYFFKNYYPINPYLMLFEYSGRKYEKIISLLP